MKRVSLVGTTDVFMYDPESPLNAVMVTKKISPMKVFEDSDATIPMEEDLNEVPPPPVRRIASNGDILLPIKRLSSTSLGSLGDLVSFYMGVESFKAAHKNDPVLYELRMRIFRENKRIDAQFLEFYGSCRISPEIFPRGVSPQRLGEIISQNFNDETVMHQAHCILDTAFNQGASNEVIRTWMQQMSVLSTRSVEGVIFASTLQSPAIRLVAKLPAKPQFDLTHEAAIGVITNKLRKYIPSFAYYLTSFTCGAPVLNGPLQKGMEIRPDQWCSTDPQNQHRYVVYENVPGLTFKEFIEENGSQIQVPLMYNLILQIVISLKYAQQGCGFTHYDLHAGNIIIRPLGRPYNVVYVSPPKEEDVRRMRLTFTTFLTSFIPTIIDYGFARASTMIGGKETVVSDGGNYIYIRDTVAAPQFLAGDVYRILMWSYIHASIYCPEETVKFLEYALSYFFEENVSLDLREGMRNNSLNHSILYLPMNEETLGFDVGDFINYLGSRYSTKDFALTNNFFRNTPGLKCCLTPRQVNRKVSN